METVNKLFFEYKDNLEKKDKCFPKKKKIQVLWKNNHNWKETFLEWEDCILTGCFLFGAFLIEVLYYTYWAADNQERNPLARFLIDIAQGNRLVEILLIGIFLCSLILLFLLCKRARSTYYYGVKSGALLICRERNNYLKEEPLNKMAGFFSGDHIDYWIRSVEETKEVLMYKTQEKDRWDFIISIFTFLCSGSIFFCA